MQEGAEGRSGNKTDIRLFPDSWALRWLWRKLLSDVERERNSDSREFTCLHRQHVPSRRDKAKWRTRKCAHVFVRLYKRTIKRDVFVGFDFQVVSILTYLCLLHSVLLSSYFLDCILECSDRLQLLGVKISSKVFGWFIESKANVADRLLQRSGLVSNQDSF